MPIGSAQRHIDKAIGAFAFISQPLAGIADRGDPFEQVNRARLRRPAPARGRNFARVEKAVKRHEFARQRVVVGGHVARKQRQRCIAIARPQIAQQLVIGAVFLDDIDHVPDPPAQCRHHPFCRLRGFRWGQLQVAHHARAQRGKGRISRQGCGQQRSGLQLQDITARGAARTQIAAPGAQRVAAGARIGAGNALEIGQRQPVSDRCHSSGIPAGRCHADHLRGTARRPRQRARPIDRSHRVDPAQRHQHAALCTKRQCIGIKPPGPQRPRYITGDQNGIFGNGPAICGQCDQRVGIVARGQHAAITQRQQRGRLPLRPGARHHLHAIAVKPKRDQLAIARD